MLVATGLAWEFRLRELRLTRGFGAALGGNGFRTLPALLKVFQHTARHPDAMIEAGAYGFGQGDHYRWWSPQR
jgi:hypothetical protein